MSVLKMSSAVPSGAWHAQVAGVSYVLSDVDKVRGSVRSARFIDAADKGADGAVTGIRQEAGRDEDGTD